MDKITILMPAFNREKYIKLALTSACKQTHSNLEIIVYDDGSTDNTVNIVKSFKDNRIKLIKGEINKGVAHARNVLLDACSTKYACWLDSDDLIHPNKIELQLKEMTNPKIIFTKWVWLHQSGNEWKPKIQNTSNPAFASVMFPVRKDIRFNEKINFGGEDWDWLKKMQAIYPCNKVNEVLYSVRFHHDRIGHWKKKLRQAYDSKTLLSTSYADLVERYKKEYKR